MGKYREAWSAYNSMIANWKMFEKNYMNGKAYGDFITNAITIAKLDLPNPFAGIQDIEAEPKVEEVSEAKKESEPEVKAEAKEEKKDSKPAFKGVYNFKK